MATVDPVNVNITVTSSSTNPDPAPGQTYFSNVPASSNNLATFGGTLQGGTFGAPYNQPFGGQMWPEPETGAGAWNQPCLAGHILDTESVYEEDASIVGHCIVCKNLMRVNRLPGGMPYFKAGKLIGEAMALDEDDNEGLADLLGDLKKLELDIEKETEKLRRAQQLVKLSRSIVTKKAIADAQTGVTAD